MKAKEYYAKYKERVASLDYNESIQAICEMIADLSAEAKATIDKRNVKTDCGCVAVLREMNDKYNAVCRMLEEEYKDPILARDGFLIYWRKQIPELDARLKRKESGNVPRTI